MGLQIETTELVALSASIAGNCIPCLEWHYKKCIELGIPKEEIRQTIEIAKKVKQAPIKKINEVADQLLSDTA